MFSLVSWGPSLQVDRALELLFGAGAPLFLGGEFPRLISGDLCRRDRFLRLSVVSRLLERPCLPLMTVAYPMIPSNSWFLAVGSRSVRMAMRFDLVCGDDLGHSSRCRGAKRAPRERSSPAGRLLGRIFVPIEGFWPASRARCATAHLSSTGCRPAALERIASWNSRCKRLLNIVRNRAKDFARIEKRTGRL